MPKAQINRQTGDLEWSYGIKTTGLDDMNLSQVKDCLKELYKRVEMDALLTQHHRDVANEITLDHGQVLWTTPILNDRGETLVRSFPVKQSEAFTWARDNTFPIVLDMDAFQMFEEYIASTVGQFAPNQPDERKHWFCRFWARVGAYIANADGLNTDDRRSLMDWAADEWVYCGGKEFSKDRPPFVLISDGVTDLWVHRSECV